MSKKDRATYRWNTPAPAKLATSYNDQTESLSQLAALAVEALANHKRDTEPQAVASSLVWLITEAEGLLHAIDCVFNIDLDGVLTDVLREARTDSPELPAFIGNNGGEE